MSETPGVLAQNMFRQIHTPEGMDIGHIRYEPVDVLNIPATSLGVKVVTWPYPVGISSAQLTRIINDTDSSEITDYGDRIWSYVDIEHPSCLATATAAIDDTVINLPPAVLAGIQLSIGDFLALGDDIEADVHLHVTAVDRETGDVTFDTPLVAAIGAGTQVHMHRFFVGRPDLPYRVIPGIIRRWGEDTFDSALVPTGVPLKIVYKNNSAGARTVFGEVSILYGDA